MTKSSNEIGTPSYVLAALGFIPGLGVLFALISIILGLIERKRGGRVLVMLGGLGIVSTLLLAATMYVLFTKKDGIGAAVKNGTFVERMNTQLAQASLLMLTKNIEYYKTTQGHYPESLPDLQTLPGQSNNTFIYDPMQIKDRTAKKPALFFYQLTPDKTHYYLLGIGADHQPFTADDVLPTLPEEERAKGGLLIKKIAPSSPSTISPAPNSTKTPQI